MKRLTVEGDPAAELLGLAARANELGAEKLSQGLRQAALQLSAGDTPGCTDRVARLLPGAPRQLSISLNRVLGWLLLGSKNPEQATHYFETAVRHDHADLSSRACLAKLLWMQSTKIDPMRALIVLERAEQLVALGPTSAVCRILVALRQVIKHLQLGSFPPPNIGTLFSSRTFREYGWIGLLSGLLSALVCVAVVHEATPPLLFGVSALTTLAALLVADLTDGLAWHDVPGGLIAAMRGWATGLLTCIAVLLIPMIVGLGIIWYRTSSGLEAFNQLTGSKSVIMPWVVAMLQVASSFGMAMIWGQRASVLRIGARALEFSRKAVEEEADKAETWLVLADTLNVVLHDAQRATKYLDEASQLNHSSTFHIDLAEYWLDEGNLPRFRKEAKRAEAAADLQVAGLTRLGQLYERAGDTDKALNAYKLNQSWAPQETVSYVRAGQILLNSGKAAEAAEMLRKAWNPQVPVLPVLESFVEACSVIGQEVEALRMIDQVLNVQGSQTKLRQMRMRLVHKFPYLDKFAPPSPGLEELPEGAELRPWEPGDVLMGRYEVEKVLEGGMGAVYLVRDQQLHYRYAAKTVLGSYLNDDHALGRILREADIWIEMGRHPNIVSAEFIARVEGRVVLFLEYVDGGNMSELIRNQRLTVAQALELGMQLAEGMRFAYESRQLVHRDLKPANVMLTSSGVAKITDFGLSHARGASFNFEEFEGHVEGGSQITQEGTVLGTPRYMAPEQFIDARSVGPTADIYSFGCILFEMLCDNPPFLPDNSRSLLGWMKVHTMTPPPDPCQLNTDVPNEVREVLLKCLAKTPEDRYQSFADVRSKLEEAYTHLTRQKYQFPVEPAMEQTRYFNDRGVSQLMLSRVDRAVTALWKAVEVDGNSAVSWSNLGSALAVAGHYEDAATCVQRANVLQSSLSIAWCNQAAVLQYTGDLLGALRATEHAIALENDSAESWINRSSVCLALNRPDQAEQCADRAIALNGQRGAAYNNRAASLYSQGRTTDAVKCLEQGVEADARQPALWYNWAVIQLGEGNPEQALTCVERALAQEESNPMFRCLHGLILETQHKNDGALWSFKRALEVDPNLKQAQAGVERLSGGESLVGEEPPKRVRAEQAPA